MGKTSSNSYKWIAILLVATLIFTNSSVLGKLGAGPISAQAEETDTYTLTIDPYDGYFDVDSSWKYYDDTYSMTFTSKTDQSESPIKNLERPGYKLKGWFAGIRSEYVEGAELLDTADVKIKAGTTEDKYYTAIWELQTYTITYKGLDGATNSPVNPTEYTIETPSTIIQAPTKAGWEFAGWKEDVEDYISFYPGIYKGESYGNKVLTATWVKSTLKGTIKVTGKAEYGETLTASVNAENLVDGNSLSYQWIRIDNSGEVAIKDATGLSYTITKDDIGKRLYMKVTSTGSGTQPGEIVSSCTNAVSKAKLRISLTEDITKTYDGSSKAMVSVAPFEADLKADDSDYSVMVTEAYYDDQYAGNNKVVTVDGYKIYDENKKEVSGVYEIVPNTKEAAIVDVSDITDEIDITDESYTTDEIEIIDENAITAETDAPAVPLSDITTLKGSITANTQNLSDSIATEVAPEGTLDLKKVVQSKYPLHGELSFSIAEPYTGMISEAGIFSAGNAPETSYSVTFTSGGFNLGGSDANEYETTTGTILVTVKADAKKMPAFSFVGITEGETKNITVRGGWASNAKVTLEDGAPAHTGAITYSSSNPDVVCLIDEKDSLIQGNVPYGNVTAIAMGVGTARVFASISGDSSYLPATTCYTVVVTEWDQYLANSEDIASEASKRTFVYEEGKAATVLTAPENAGFKVTGNTATDAGEYTAELTLEPSYVWKTGTKIGTTTITDYNKTHTIRVPWSITKAENEKGSAAPTTPKANNAEHKINGVDDDMEYTSVSADAEDCYWFRCDGTSINNLPEGTYYIRYKGDENHKPSAAASVTIAAAANVRTVRLVSTKGQLINPVLHVASGDPILSSDLGEVYGFNGYTLKGWYTEIGGKGTKYEIDKTPVTNDLTLYADWNADVYTITYKSNLPSGVEWTNPNEEIKSYTADNPNIYLKEASVDSSTGYRFAGWTGIFAEQTPLKNVKILTDMAKNIELTAVFEAHYAIAPTADPVSGTTFNDTLTVTLKTEEAASNNPQIYYNLGEGEFTLYSEPIVLKDTATIYAYATAKDKEKSETVEFTYTKAPSVPVTGITVDPKEAIISEEKGTTTLKATVLPADNTESLTISWTSSEPTVATVANGVVTALKEGVTTVTASVTNSAGQSFTASSVITVKYDVRYNAKVTWTQKFPSKFTKGTAAPVLKYKVTYTSVKAGKKVTTDEISVTATTKDNFSAGSADKEVTFTAVADMKDFFVDIEGKTPATNVTLSKTYKFKEGSDESRSDNDSGNSEGEAEDNITYNLFYTDNDIRIPLPKGADPSKGSGKWTNYYTVDANGSVTLKVTDAKDVRTATNANNSLIVMPVYDGDNNQIGEFEYQLPVFYLKPALKLSSKSGSVKKGATEAQTLYTTVLGKKSTGVYEPINIKDQKEGVSFWNNSSGTAPTVKAGPNDGELIIEAKGKTSGKIAIRQDSWRETILLTYSIKESRKNVLIASTKQVNMNVNATASTTVQEVYFTLNGSDEISTETGITVTMPKKWNEANIEVEGINIASGKLTDSTIGFKYKNDASPKKGNYTFTFMTSDGAKANVKVAVSNKALDKAVTLKVVTKMDVTRGQKMVLVPDLKNIGGQIDKIELKDKDENFEVEYNKDMNQIYVSAVEGKNVAAGKFEKTFKVTVDGVECTSTVKTKITAKKPAVKISKVNLPKKVGAMGEASIRATVKQAGKIFEVVPTAVKFTNGTANEELGEGWFNVEGVAVKWNEESGTISTVIVDNTKVKKSVKVEITFAGNVKIKKTLTIKAK
jgi:uncharacterized repeat protein (TIGR02543 family)